MQAKKAKQLLKARLARERQIYEMRKRAELKAAVSELERPWEVVEKAPKLFSASADEQVQVLADRFQRPGGFDLWSEKDGPQLFQTVDGVPSARFFPKGVVHSIKPYGRIGDDNVEEVDEFGNLGSDLENGSGEKLGVSRSRFKKNLRSGSDEDYTGSKKLLNEGRSGEGSKGKFRKKGNGRRIGLANSGSTDNGLDSRRVGFDQEKSGSNRVFQKDGPFSRGMRPQKFEGSNSEFYDMSLQHDGSYGFQEGNWVHE